MTNNNSVPKKLSFISIYFLDINTVIGSGTFLLLSVIYCYMSLTAILAFLCTAVTVSTIVLCYADLPSRSTQSGIAWLYSYNALGRFAGYEFGIFARFLGCTTLSAEVVALLIVLKSSLPISKNNVVYIGSTIFLILLSSVINFFGRSWVKTVNNISAATKIVTLIVFIIVGTFFIKKANFTSVIPYAVLTGVTPFLKHFGDAFTLIFYLFTGFSFIPVAVKQMNNPEKNVLRVLIAVTTSVTILDCLVFLAAIGLNGQKLGSYSNPPASILKTDVGQWGFAFMIIGMLISIFDVAFSASFNTSSLIASLANEHGMLLKWTGKKNKHDALWVGIIFTAILPAALATQSYLSPVSCTVLASFVQYVPSISAVIEFRHSNEYPAHDFSLPGKYTVPIITLIISRYMVTNFTPKTLLLGAVVAVPAATCYFFIDKDEKLEKEYDDFLVRLRHIK